MQRISPNKYFEEVEEDKRKRKQKGEKNAAVQ